MDISKEQLLNDLQEVGNDFDKMAIKHNKTPKWVYEQLLKYDIYTIENSKAKGFSLSRDQFLKDLQELGCASHIGPKYGLSKQWGLFYAKRNGIELKKVDNSIYDNQIYKLYYNDKKSLGEIAKTLNLSPSSVQNRFRINNWQMRDHKSAIKKRKIDVDDAIAMYNNGFSTVKIANKYNCSSQSVNLLLRSRGIKMRPPFTVYDT